MLVQERNALAQLQPTSGIPSRRWNDYRRDYVKLRVLFVGTEVLYREG
jgi:hypothetical protein